MSIVLPDWRVNDSNPDFNVTEKYGCQVLAMSFQNKDTNLIAYNKFFEQAKYAFALKTNAPPIEEGTCHNNPADPTSVRSKTVAACK